VDVSQISDLVELGDITERIRIKEQAKVIRSLSSTNFWGKQADVLERAQIGTGLWVFEDERFKSWLTGPPQLLWCKGDAGAGKTTLSAIVIDHLFSVLKRRDSGIAWLYIDYREHDLHTVENLFANLLVQLFKQLGEVPKSVMESPGFNWEGANPSPMAYKAWLQEAVQKFARTIIIIDALDELRTKELCQQFISELQSLIPRIHILVTSRSDLKLPLLQREGVEIEIQPRKDDVILYVEGRMKKSQRIWDHVLDDPSLRELTIKMLTTATDRM
jgi:NACHT domain